MYIGVTTKDNIPTKLCKIHSIQESYDTSCYTPIHVFKMLMILLHHFQMLFYSFPIFFINNVHVIWECKVVPE